MSTLHVVRHGQASFQAADYDVLSPLGVLQSRRLGELLAARGAPLDAVFSGPRRRQIDTARHAVEALRSAGATAPDAIVLDDLDEFPAFEIMKYAVPRLVESDPSVRELVARIGGGAPDDPGARGALQPVFERVMSRWVHGELHLDGDIESFAAFEARVRRAIDHVMAMVGRRRRALVATSGGPVGITMRMALGLDAQRTIDVTAVVANAAITTYRFTEQRMTLAVFNATPHLAPAELTYV